MDIKKKPRKRRRQSPELIERRLNDKKWEVRCTLAERMDWTPTPDQLKRGLTDKHYLVREAWIYRKDLVLTQEVIEIGLTDAWEDNRIKCAEMYFKKLVAKKGTTPTPKQIQRGLSDVSEKVRDLWISHLRRQLCAVLDDDDDGSTFQSI
jgi:hypothetical protein